MNILDYEKELELTEVEKKGVVELKRRVWDDLKPAYRTDNLLFLRFLRARECNLNKAEAMLRAHLQWREKLNADFIHQYNFPEVWKNYFAGGYIGTDNEGAVVYYISVGKIDLKHAIKWCIKRNDIMNSLVKLLETYCTSMKLESAKRKKPIYQWVLILDFEEFSLFSATNKNILNLLVQIASMYESNYPERLKKAIVLNASTYFLLLFSVIKPFLSERTFRKIKIFGSDGYVEECRKTIDDSTLPVFLGGKREEPPGDPRCSAFLVPGGPIPSSYYLHNVEHRLCNQVDVSKLVVPRFSKKEVTILVHEPGSSLEWEFESKSGDINFGIDFKAEDSEKLEVLAPVERADADIGVEIGNYPCDKAGLYMLVFDNTYSWLKQKEIYYRVSVINPTGNRIILTA